MHTANAVRVKVLDTRLDADPLAALDIAWKYDIVITTFQRLSLEGSLGKQSALAQVDHCQPLICTYCIMLPLIAPAAVLHVYSGILSASHWHTSKFAS